jgi:hypothetical protein
VYSTCLFCQRSLGRNDQVERFRVGRRLAFDAARGRLWAVCPHCARWNLTPLDERWEAIEACERLFPAAVRRAVTSNVTLARHPSGLELVRVGRTEPHELAAWRWGRVMRTRRVYHRLVHGAEGVIAIAAILAAPVVALGPLQVVSSMVDDARRRRAAQRLVTRVPVARGDRVLLRAGQLDRASFVTYASSDWGLLVPLDDGTPAAPPKTAPRPAHAGLTTDGASVTLVGSEATRVTTLLLARRNDFGGSADEVEVAVRLLATTRSREALVARTIARLAGERRPGFTRDHDALAPSEMLMLEMARAEDVEDLALTGDFSALEAAWRDAEEIAAIADGLLTERAWLPRLARAFAPVPAPAAL